MHANHRYLLEHCQRLSATKTVKILDYGCGAGEVVEEGKKLQLRIWGVETFYEGGNTRHIAEGKGLLRREIKEIVDGRVPFSDDTFDLVISNQVFEHVRDLKEVFSEIRRVLKPGGSLLCLFPTKEAVFEGHCGIPIIHWFPKSSRLRFYWMLGWRRIGYGYFKEGKSPRKWSRDFLDWLDKYVFYRSTSEIHDDLLSCFESIEHLEDHYVEYRLNLVGVTGISKLVRRAPFSQMARWFCRKYGGLVILAMKPGAVSVPPFATR